MLTVSDVSRGSFTLGGRQISLHKTQLVILCVCMTGQVDPEHGEEMLGMVRGFLGQGVPAVLAANWCIPVGINQRLGNLLDPFLCAYLEENLPIEQAFHQALRSPHWKRDQVPVHQWGYFTMFGCV